MRKETKEETLCDKCSGTLFIDWITEWKTPQGGLVRNIKYLCGDCKAPYYKTEEISSMMLDLYRQRKLDLEKMRLVDNEADTEDKCEACGGEIITRGNCGACLECDAQWGEPEYVECEHCGGEAIIDALGFFCLDCNYQC